MAIDYHSYIVRDPAICAGEAVLAGTRVSLRTVLASLAEGLDTQQIIEHFPTLSPAAVRAVIAFAAVSTEENLPLPSARPLPRR